MQSLETSLKRLFELSLHTKVKSIEEHIFAIKKKASLHKLASNNINLIIDYWISKIKSYSPDTNVIYKIIPIDDNFSIGYVLLISPQGGKTYIVFSSINNILHIDRIEMDDCQTQQNLKEQNTILSNSNNQIEGGAIYGKSTIQ